jgi:predicted DsbA family dithiol-disulfide isomerase
MTNYLDVISSWCYWAIPAWQELRARYSDRVDFQWRIALMDKKGLPPTRAHTEWYYKRSGTLMRSPRMLSAAWVEPNATEYLAPNCVAEAAREFGIEDDRVWTALSRAELHDGKKIGHWDVSVEVGAEAADLDLDLLLQCAQSTAVETRLRKSTADFHALQVTQRPTFVIDSPIGDRAVFSGFAKVAPMAAALDTMLDDIVGYESYAAHFGDPPA